MAGTKMGVVTVARPSPPITTKAIGAQRFDSSERLSAIGRRPMIVVEAVMEIGRIRLKAAVMTDL